MAFASSSGYLWLIRVVTLLCLCMLLILLVVHTYNVIVDLCCKARTSLAYLGGAASMPDISRPYKLTMAFNCCSIFLFFCSILSVAVLDVFIAQTSKTTLYPFCKSLLLFHIQSYWVAKLFMWFVFLLRLHAAYKDSVYQYSKKTLISVAVIITVHTVFVLAVFTFDQKVTPNDDYTDCHVTVSLYLIAIAMLTEVLLNAVGLYAFIRPLKQLAKATKNNDLRATSHRQSDTFFMRIRSKLMVLNSMMCISTLVGLFYAIIIPGSGLLTRIDVVINCVCLMLTTLYYPHEKYYRTICCLVIRCCSIVVNIKEAQNEEKGKGVGAPNRSPKQELPSATEDPESI
mmetsp:Transcript_31396/g.50867  ORF Transcript_31396/g.50867 Transcript_31396/m.50867 type:complete len:343 (-) Transcript_31396:211-1239(-)